MNALKQPHQLVEIIRRPESILGPVAAQEMECIGDASSARLGKLALERGKGGRRSWDDSASRTPRFRPPDGQRIGAEAPQVHWPKQITPGFIPDQGPPNIRTTSFLAVL